jgi:hypothetical protein
MENEEERRKFEIKWISDEKVTSKIVKSSARAVVYGSQVSISYRRSAELGFRTVFADIRSPSADRSAVRRFQPDLMTVIYSF